MKLMKNYTDVKKDGINMRTKKYIFYIKNIISIGLVFSVSHSLLSLSWNMMA